MKKKIVKINPLTWGVLGVAMGLYALFIILIGFKLFSSVPIKPLQKMSQAVSFPIENQLAVSSDSAKTASPSANDIASDRLAISTPGGFPVVPPSPTGSAGIPIVMYHYVGNNPNPADRQRDILSITTDKLDEQFNWLSKNGYTPVTLDTLYGIFSKKENISKPIVLTFDDGYIDFYYNAFQILRKYNFHAVSFIITGLAGTAYYMPWDQIREMNNSGLVSFQAHTVSHPSLPTLSYADQLSQLVSSKKTLEQNLGTTVNFIAYPYGSSDPETWRAALAAGFVGGVGTWPGKAAGPGINMPRIRITGNLSLGDFIQKITN